MGLFTNLFGRGNKGTFQPSSALMAEDQFWSIIKSTYEKARGNFELQQQQLAKALRKLPLQDIISFENRFRQLRGEANNWQVWGAIYLIHGGCGDDSFMDFRGWLIVQGKELYYKTLSDPESLGEINKKQIDVDWEGMGYVASTVFEELTDSEIPSEFEENNEVKGREWREEGDDLKKMFPKLWAKYNDCPLENDDPTWSRKEPPAGL